ncbi:MAG: family 20 glycosylhydrolase [Alistipes sp.]|nr:family 20 glycosylhydrolase [Alistipes sp.]
MRRFWLIILFCAIIFQLPVAAQNVVPEPKKFEKRNGAFNILTTTKITHYPGLRSLAERLAEYVPLDVREYNAGEKGNIVLREKENLPAEAYSLEVSAEGIVIEGGSPAGVHNGVETLLQLLPSMVYSHELSFPVAVGCCVVEDEPRFAYRGFMLDVCRTWMSVEEVKTFVERLAHHKINKLHIHLSDDEGWRIEIKSHPDLTEVGGYRGVGSPVAARYGKWDERYGGFYTQDQMREIVEYAAVRNIEIIPEIDLPGHSHNLARVRPEILCNYTPGLKASDGYDTRSVMCVAKQSNYELLDDIFRELADIFPSKWVHIGGDEVNTSQWSRCPDCKALMASEGIGIDKLQEHFMNRVAKIVGKYGKNPCVWNEAMKAGTLTKSAQVYGWESVAACRKAAAEGYKTVVMPGAYFYFDMRQTQREPGHDWAAIFDVKKPLSFDFMEQGFTEAEMANVAGVQASFFSELYISHRDDENDYIYYQTYPRICALSELAWRGKGGEWKPFYAKMVESHYSRMVAMGVDFRLFPPVVSYADGVLKASTDDRAHIYYKKVGEDGEKRYERPIITDKPQLYSFHTRMGGAKSPEAAVKSHWRMLQPTVTITSSMEPSERFPFSNAEGYGRIARTARVCREGDWLLYTFEKPVSCRRMEISTGNLQLPRYIFNAGYMEYSEDGVNFKRVGELKNGGCVIENPSRPIKAVRIVCTENGNGADFVTIQAPKVYPKL